MQNFLALLLLVVFYHCSCSSPDSNSTDDVPSEEQDSKEDEEQSDEQETLNLSELFAVKLPVDEQEAFRKKSAANLTSNFSVSACELNEYVSNRVGIISSESSGNYYELCPGNRIEVGKALTLNNTNLDAEGYTIKMKLVKIDNVLYKTTCNFYDSGTSMINSIYYEKVTLPDEAGKVSIERTALLTNDGDFTQPHYFMLERTPTDKGVKVKSLSRQVVYGEDQNDVSDRNHIEYSTEYFEFDSDKKMNEDIQIFQHRRLDEGSEWDIVDRFAFIRAASSSKSYAARYDRKRSDETPTYSYFTLEGYVAEVSDAPELLDSTGTLRVDLDNAEDLEPFVIKAPEDEHFWDCEGETEELVYACQIGNSAASPPWLCDEL